MAGGWSRGHEVGRQAGSPIKVSDEEVLRIAEELKRGAVAHGYTAELWTLPRVRRLVIDLFGRKLSISETWRLLRRIGWSSQKPVRRARERDEEKIENWKQVEWPRIQAKAREEQRTLVFIDESGLSQKPAAKNTWAPEGETPVLQMNFSWKKLSVIGGITIRSIYFQLHEESVKAPQVIEFLQHLQKHIKGNLLIVWDNLPAHRSKLVADYLASTQGRVWVERLPGYAPELNPIEYLWGYAKNNDLANLAPKDLWELSSEAKKALRKIRRMPRCIKAFWVQSTLNFD
jgi:transposase